MDSKKEKPNPRKNLIFVPKEKGNIFVFKKQKNIGCIILVVAGLFELAFAFCLGNAKFSMGSEMYFWYAAFLVTLSLSIGLLIKAT